ncbi:MAG: hypothetical protein J6S76_03370, partial [Clostridia bacterium]|nr:hypothetical protein [Clostridia bacterium]
VCILLGGFFYKKYRTTLTFFAAFAVFCGMLAVGISVHNELVREDVILTYSVYKKNDVVTLISDGCSVLIDDSDGAYTSASAGWEQLSAQNQTEIDVYMLTHYHDRHAVTLSKMLHDTIIRQLLIPEPQTDDELRIAEKLSDIAGNAGVKVQRYRAGSDMLTIGFAEIAPLPRVYLDRSTQPVIGWTLYAHGQTLLLLGGGAAEAEDTVFTNQRDTALLRANTILFGIHGPKYKNTVTPLLQQCAALERLVLASEELSVFCDGMDLDIEPLVLSDGDSAQIRIRCEKNCSVHGN